ncbi:hypothetical protein DEU56DRAFT_95880 [Suillus clintonianus]|uniref:uncharacterized protein n=1 Tax=Suillus clintonianus TaxID=1904413 RepID=UPI001B882D48|nr:uncharacterized protein DEU56DRAFT_95880 [Suillus clintonianus]KAG2121444.1 hypothetical protein DEU56DRAFT_95880 [Suillus clintonianus]
MSEYNQATLTLLDCPVEILLKIFGHLDVYELVRARQICNYTQQAIDSSLEFLYSIDLKYFHAIPVTVPGSADTDVQGLRQSLRQRESAWQNAQYSSNALDPVPCPLVMYRWSSGVLGFPVAFLGRQVGQTKRILFLQPQPADGHSSAPNLRQWSCQVDHPFPHFNFSPAQDLMVYLAEAPWGANHAFDVCFRSLSEDNVHPEAVSPVLKAIDKDIDLELFNLFVQKSSIFGDYYGVLFRNVIRTNGAADFLQIWNWKSKDAFQCIEAFDLACDTMDFSFLTNEKILVANARELSLYSLVQSSNSLKITAKFSLPPLRSPFEYKYFNFTPIPFHAHAHNQMISFSMNISGGGLATDPCFTLFVERNALLELESTYTSRYGKATEDSPSLPWSSWGPNHTRSFVERSRDPCKHSVSGFRSVSLAGDRMSEREKRPLCIRDFNPHRVADFKAGNGSRLNQRLIEGEPTSSNMFLEPLGSGLPYLETITEEKFVATDMNVEANRVTLLMFETGRTFTMSQSGQGGPVKYENLQRFEVLDFQ